MPPTPPTEETEEELAALGFTPEEVANFVENDMDGPATLFDEEETDPEELARYQAKFGGRMVLEPIEPEDLQS